MRYRCERVSQIGARARWSCASAEITFALSGAWTPLIEIHNANKYVTMLKNASGITTQIQFGKPITSAAIRPEVTRGTLYIASFPLGKGWQVSVCLKTLYGLSPHILTQSD